MKHLGWPSEFDRNSQREWFEGVFDVDERGGGYVIGEQATALLIDLQCIYCAGAFVSVVVMSCTIVDCHLREAELPRNFKGGIKAVFESSAFAQELDWLRKYRNQLVHFGPTQAVTVDDDSLFP